MSILTTALASLPLTAVFAADDGHSLDQAANNPTATLHFETNWRTYR